MFVSAGSSVHVDSNVHLVFCVCMLCVKFTPLKLGCVQLAGGSVQNLAERLLLVRLCRLSGLCADFSTV